jgi:hypothetical protein
VTLDILWWRRNDHVFNNEFQYSVKLKVKVLATVSAINNSFDIISSINKQQRNGNSIEGISWRAPERDWVALNTDGSMVDLGSNAACGGILRDSNGCFLVAFAARLHNVSMLEAELWGIYHGLKLAWERGFRKIIVYSDSLIAINLLKDGCPSLILYVPL